MAKMKVVYGYSAVCKEPRNTYDGLSFGRAKRMARNKGMTIRDDGTCMYYLVSQAGTHAGLFIKGSKTSKSRMMFWPSALKDAM